MGLGQSFDQLDGAWRTLRNRWQLTRDVWRDRTAARFEETIWVPLGREVEPTLRELERLGRVIEQARQNVR